MNKLLLDMTIRLFREQRKQESRPVLGSIIGIALSMIPLIVVLFLSDGMIKGITNRYIETGTFHMQLRPYEKVDSEQWEQLRKQLSELDGIEQIFREHNGMGIAFADGDDQSAVSIRAIDQRLYHEDKGFSEYIEILEGEFNLDNPQNAVVGQYTAEMLSLSPGDSIRILSGKTLSTGKYIPKISTFKVAGIFTTGYQELDKLWMFISLDKGIRILQDNDSKSMFLIKTKDPYGDIQALGQKIRPLLANQRWGIYTWQTLNRSQQSNYQSTRMLLILIALLIVLIAVMNISSSMVMLVMENEQEIGILKSMGMPNRFLQLQYSLSSGIAGALGSAVGILIGIGLVLNFGTIISGIEALLNGMISLGNTLQIGNGQSIELLNKDYYLENFSISVDIPLCILIFAGTIVLSMAAAFIPLRSIGKITPLDILRKH